MQNKTKKRRLTARKIRFFRSQLFTLVALESTKTCNQLNPAAAEACDDAISVAATALDKLVADCPDLQEQADKIIASFHEQQKE
jgi:hypothetical protein